MRNNFAFSYIITPSPLRELNTCSSEHPPTLGCVSPDKNGHSAVSICGPPAPSGETTFTHGSCSIPTGVTPSQIRRGGLAAVYTIWLFFPIWTTLFPYKKTKVLLHLGEIHANRDGDQQQHHCGGVQAALLVSHGGHLLGLGALGGVGINLMSEQQWQRSDSV